MSVADSRRQDPPDQGRHLRLRQVRAARPGMTKFAASILAGIFSTR